MEKLLYLPRKWKGRWWPSRTSNPVHWVNSLVGGFDSHALPPSKYSAALHRKAIRLISLLTSL